MIVYLPRATTGERFPPLLLHAFVLVHTHTLHGSFTSPEFCVGYLRRWSGISNVVAVETNGDDTLTLAFIRSFYLRLAQGFTLRDSFDAGVYR